jgi:hypothetical protein
MLPKHPEGIIYFLLSLRQNKTAERTLAVLLGGLHRFSCSATISITLTFLKMYE